MKGIRRIRAYRALEGDTIETTTGVYTIEAIQEDNSALYFLFTDNVVMPIHRRQFIYKHLTPEPNKNDKV